MKISSLSLIASLTWAYSGFATDSIKPEDEILNPASKPASPSVPPVSPSIPPALPPAQLQDASWGSYLWSTACTVTSNVVHYGGEAWEKAKRAKYRVEAGTNYVVGVESPPFAFVTGAKLLKAIQETTGKFENPDFEWWQLIGATMVNHIIEKNGNYYEGSMMITSLSYYKYVKSESYDPLDPHKGLVKYEAQNVMAFLKIEKLLKLLNEDQLKLNISDIKNPTQPSGSFRNYWRQKKRQDFTIQDNDPSISGNYCLLIDVITYLNHENSPEADFIDQMRARTFSKTIAQNIPLLKTIDPDTFKRLSTNLDTQHYMEKIKIPNALEILEKLKAEKDKAAQKIESPGPKGKK